MLTAKQEVDVLFCLVPENVGLLYRGRRGHDGDGHGFTATLPVHVLRNVLPASEQVDTTHPVA